MSTVERIKSMCKEKGLSVSKLEKLCHFGNGYINNLRRDSMPYDRLVSVASVLEVSPDYLLTGEEKPLVNGDPALTEYLQELSERSEMRMLFHVTRNATKEQVEAIVKMVEAMQEGGML